MPSVDTTRILIISTNGFEQSELEVPRDRLREAGATVHVASPDGYTIRGWDGDDWGRMAEVELSVADVSVDDYDALVLGSVEASQFTSDQLQMVADFVSEDKEVVFHSENGILGMGPLQTKRTYDPWIVNAGKQNVTLRTGASIVHHADIAM